MKVLSRDEREQLDRVLQSTNQPILQWCSLCKAAHQYTRRCEDRDRAKEKEVRRR